MNWISLKSRTRCLAFDPHSRTFALMAFATTVASRSPMRGPTRYAVTVPLSYATSTKSDRRAVGPLFVPLIPFMTL